jgi:amino acid transporter
MSVTEILFGRPLASEEERAESVDTVTAIPVLGLDALASAAYGPEAALTVLLPLGLAGVHYIGPITIAVVALLLVVFFSYRQTIAAYPGGGGAYTVAKENLGGGAALLASSALALDYLLNVAVAISAGVGALASAVPRLLPHTLACCLLVLALLTIVNLRGVRSAGLMFALPTYLFIFCLFVVVGVGIYRASSSGWHPHAVVPPPRLAGAGAAAGAASTWLLLRAFASGCTAMTGVEAVSNAVPIFRPPAVERARRTLATIVGTLAVLLVGVALLCRAYRIGATPPGQTGYQSVLSQIVAAVSGRGVFYYVTMGAIVAVLGLSANTSFADFPRLCRVMALDEFLPASFAHRGRRLVYSAGIALLAIGSGLLLVIFRGVTDRLIPLFAIGAFLAFTLSQLGMVFHWRRSKHVHARKFMFVNGVGAFATAGALAIVALSKFTEGAWISLLVIPFMVAFFRAMQRYYAQIDREIAAAGPVDFGGLKPPVVVVPLQRLDRVARQGLRFASQISRDVRVVQVLTEARDEEDLSPCWAELVEAPAAAIGLPKPRLHVIRSKYRELISPLLDEIHRVSAEDRERPVAVLVAELVERRWYHMLLHNHRATLLKSLLLMRGGPQIVVINTPWYLTD